MMNRQFGNGIEVFFQDDWFETYPRCKHGPMLLFERLHQHKLTGKQFFACSASRDKSVCKAFVKFEDLDLWKRKYGQSSIGNNCEVSGSSNNFSAIVKSATMAAYFCFQCEKLVLSQNQHKIHNVQKLDKHDLFHPSLKVLKALDSNKTNAQYFLTPKSLNFLVKSLKTLDFTHVICMGMPRLHEILQCPFINKENCKCLHDLNSKDKNNSSHRITKSILLDIDVRFQQFSLDDNFCKFNMFNHFFFDECSKTKFMNFIKDCKKERGKICIVTDPPFGGLVEALAVTLDWITSQIEKLNNQSHILKPNFFWLFPYFMEKRIASRLNEVRMLEYVLGYTNHKKFAKKNNKNQKPSPVRIFTNCNDKIPLPINEGYKFCQLCNRYVSLLNKHCDKCNCCPSKDGRTYIHCNKCSRCVKPGKIHCNTCNICENKNHTCHIKEKHEQTCKKPTIKRKELNGEPPVSPKKPKYEHNEDPSQKENNTKIAISHVKYVKHMTMFKYNSLPSHRKVKRRASFSKNLESK